MSDPSTPYRHPSPESQLWNLHHAMDYNAVGQPVLRVNNSASSSLSDGRSDAFGRQRVAEPFTLFDSAQRYTNRPEQWETRLVGAGGSVYVVNQSLSELTVTNASGDKVTRESKRVFSYQPGKSLQVMASFAFDEGQTGLAQRVGYFNDQNGIFVTNKNGINYIVKRSYITGSAVDTEIAQSNWNVDKLDGTTATGIVLDLTKTQILFMDIEWLGVGQVRVGFVINGNFYLAHAFQHANVIDTTYITTATLPVRYEIENLSTTVASSAMKQICATVISEGGYQVRGRPFSAGRPVTSAMNLATAGTFYPLVSIRLNSSYLDAVAVIKNISMLGIANNGRMQYKLVADATITGGSWTNFNGSLVQYNISAASMSGGVALISGYVGINNQSGQTIALDPGAFQFQLERNGLAGTAITYTLAVTAAADNDDALGSIDWEEFF